MENDKLADIIERNVDNIVEEWVRAVHDSRHIRSSEDLSEGGLRDHLPQVLEEIIVHLRTNIVPDVLNTREARVSAYTRYTQNYRISELISEIALLRGILFNYLYVAMDGQRSVPDLAGYFRDLHCVNLYLDEEMRYGSSIFCESLREIQ